MGMIITTVWVLWLIFLVLLAGLVPVPPWGRLIVWGGLLILTLVAVMAGAVVMRGG
jgi:hypothetical protein